jgi:hypothetical protein
VDAIAFVMLWNYEPHSVGAKLMELPKRQLDVREALSPVAFTKELEDVVIAFFVEMFRDGCDSRVHLCPQTVVPLTSALRHSFTSAADFCANLNCARVPGQAGRRKGGRRKRGGATQRRIPLRSEAMSSAGTYRCTNCGYEMSVQSLQSLPPRPKCDGPYEWQVVSGGDALRIHTQTVKRSAGRDLGAEPLRLGYPP